MDARATHHRTKVYGSSRCATTGQKVNRSTGRHLYPIALARMPSYGTVYASVPETNPCRNHRPSFTLLAPQRDGTAEASTGARLGQKRPAEIHFTSLTSRRLVKNSPVTPVPTRSGERALSRKILISSLRMCLRPRAHENTSRASARKSFLD